MGPMTGRRTIPGDLSPLHGKSTISSNNYISRFKSRSCWHLLHIVGPESKLCFIRTRTDVRIECNQSMECRTGVGAIRPTVQWPPRGVLASWMASSGRGTMLVNASTRFNNTNSLEDKSLQNITLYCSDNSIDG